MAERVIIGASFGWGCTGNVGNGKNIAIVAKASILETAQNPIAAQAWWRRRGVWLGHGLPLLLYLLGALVFTWPLAIHLDASIIHTRHNDAYQFLWHLWWFKHSLFDLHQLPFYTDLLFYPQRVSLVVDSFSVALGASATVPQFLFGLVPAFNLLIFLSLTLSGYGAYLLAADVCGNRGAGFVGGVVFAFCPLVSLRLNQGQLDLLVAFWLPFFVLFYRRLLRDERWRRNGLAAALCFVAMAFTSWYYAYFGLIIAGLLLLYTLVQHRARWRRVLVRGVGCLGVAWLVLAPLALRVMTEAGSGVGQQPYSSLWLNSAALADFITPGQSALWGIFGSHADATYQWLFVGFVPLGLSLLALLRDWRRAWFWAILVLAFLIMALGPTLRLTTTAAALQNPTREAAVGFPTLNRLLYALPFGSLIRIPLANVIVLMLALALLTALGLTWLLARRLPRRSTLLLPPVAALLIFLEFLPLPRTIEPLRVPPFIQTLATRPDRGPVIDLPEIGQGPGMYFQTIDGQPMVAGETARKVAYPLGDSPGIRQLLVGDSPLHPADIIDPATLLNTPAVLHAYGLAFVIFHKDAISLTPDVRQRSLAYLQAVFQHAPPLYEDDQIVVWRVADLPDATSACGAKAVLPGLNYGWDGPERGASDEIGRWMGGDGDVNLFNPTGAPLTVRLTAYMQSLNRPRHLQFLRGTQVEQQVVVPPTRQQMQVQLTLQPGANLYRLHTVEPGTRVGVRDRALFIEALQFQDVGTPVCR